MKSQRRLLGLVVAVLSYPSLAGGGEIAPTKTSARDWPQWRGPNRDGISSDTSLAGNWPTSGPPLVWKASGLGAGFSSLSLTGGRIFTMGDRRQGQFVIALAAGDGKELWSTRVADVWSPDQYSGPRATPTIDGELLYVTTPHGDIVCLHVADGRIVWRRHMQTDFKGRQQGHWGYCESPLVDGNQVICTPGGRDAGMVALDKKTGREIWRVAIPTSAGAGEGAAYSSVVISHGAGVKQYVQLMACGVVGVSTDGKYLWGYSRVANQTAGIPTPIIRDDYIFASSGYQTGAAPLKLEKSGSGVKAREVYFLEGRVFQNHHGGMVLVGDHIYAGHGHKAGAPTCLDFLTGKMVWRQNRGPGSGSAAITYADGKLFMRFEDGVMALVGATPSAYRELAVFRIPDVEQPSWSHPVVVGGRMYLREQDALLCYDVGK